MNEDRDKALECLKYLSPDCSYTDWIKIGMALKSAGCDVSDWDNWSMTGKSYKAGNCGAKWNGFKNKIGIGSLIYLASQNGYRPPEKEIDPGEAARKIKEAGKNNPEKKLEKTYQYRDETGKLLALQLRYTPKSFSQRFALVENPDPDKPDDRTQWSLKKPENFQRPLYRLKELTAAPIDETVYFVEGEKDADTLAELGFIATTTGGATNKIEDWHKPHLKGRKIVIIPDEDEDGHKYAYKVKIALYGTAALIGEPAENLKEKTGGKDISDHVQYWRDDEAADNQALQEKIKSLPVRFYRDDELKTLAKDSGDLKESLPLNIWTLSDLKMPENGEDEIFKDRFLTRGNTCLLIGQTGFGKSSFIMQSSLAWTCGLPMFGIAPARPLRILLIQAENDNGDLCEMRDGAIKGHINYLPGFDAVKAVSRIHGINEDCKTRGDFCALLNLSLIEIQKKYNEPADLVIIDPLFAFCGCDVSDQGKMSEFLRNQLNPVLKTHKCGLLLVHHTPKPPRETQQGKTFILDMVHAGAGSAELANWARAVLVISAIPNTEGLFMLSAAKRGIRLKWKDVDEKATRYRYIAHSTDNTIYWREPDASEIPETDTGKFKAMKNRRTQRELAEDAVKLASSIPETINDYDLRLMSKFDISSKKAAEIRKMAVFQKLLFETTQKDPDNNKKNMKMVYKKDFKMNEKLAHTEEKAENEMLLPVANY